MTMSYEDFKTILQETHDKLILKTKFFQNFTIAETILDE